MTNLETAYDRVNSLVVKFKSITSAERRSMNEHAVRQGYILPLFAALDWMTSDINEVSPEEKVSRGWVDFAFRISGVPRFFLETKRPSEDLNESRWVQQAIDYAWTKSVTWALLCDFEGLRVFNAEWRESDPFRAQFIEFDLYTYLSDFDRLWWLSRPETAAGRLDREAEQVGKKIKRTPVSLSLFDDLKTWRIDLFKDMHGFNPLWSPAQVDEAVLRLLNRLIFIRTAEDRQVEAQTLRPLVRTLKDQKRFKDLDKELARQFREMDATHNSELFAPHFSENMYITPTTLEEVIEGLHEKGYVRYKFNALEADVLGTVYEQYLGSVVAESQTPADAAQPRLFAEESQSVQEHRKKRKSQGIYYTPAFITQYIVQQTVGRYLEEHGYNPSRPPRVLDMACGSGSFLIEAFDTIDAYVARLRGHANGEEMGFLDHARQIEVLHNCIYGVDKDKQAVEVARLNLLLRALHTKEKLPMLENIHHGDSLHPETWEQAFPEVIKGGGFDVIIGNPPYVRQETLGTEFKEFAKANFETYAGTADLYIYFIEKAHKLLKPGGWFGMIVSNKWMRSKYGEGLRDYLHRESQLKEIIDFGELPIFQGAATFPAILITRRSRAEKQKFLYAPIKSLDFQSLAVETKEVGSTLDERAILGKNWMLASNEGMTIYEKMKTQSIFLWDYVGGKIYRGIVTGCNEVFLISRSTRDRLINDDPKSIEIIKPFVMGDDVRKYRISYRNIFVIFAKRGIDINKYQSISKYLNNYRERLTPKPQYWTGDWNGRKTGSYQWYEIQDAVDYYQEFEKPKIVYPDVAKESRFTLEYLSYSRKSALFLETQKKGVG